jgi:pimeloyl-ACP methyl ester carboxylesterase
MNHRDNASKAQPSLGAGPRPLTGAIQNTTPYGLGCLFLFGILYVLYLLALFSLQRKLIFPGTAMEKPGRPPQTDGLEVWPLPLTEGNGEALFLPGRARETNQVRRPALLFAHGNGELTDQWTEEFHHFRDLGYGILLVEYPGYGRSGGTPSSRSTGEAMRAAYDRLATDSRVDPSRIIGVGESLGGGAICALSRERRLQALVLQSTFPSLKIFAARRLAPAFLLRDSFENEAAVRLFPGPVLVMHGRFDSLVPLEQAQRLAAASPRTLLKVYDCGHGVWWSGQKVARDMEEFLAPLHLSVPQ